jgi:hypothetical protein
MSAKMALGKCVSEFVDNDRDEYGDHPQENIHRVVDTQTGHKRDDPKERMDTNREAEQAEMDIGLRSRGVAK